MKKYLIGIDIGTQGTKAILFDEDMRIVASAFEISFLVSTRPGEVFQFADDLTRAVSNTIAELIKTSKIDPAHIACIGIDGQMAGIMAVTKDGGAATYYDSWLDTRCEKYMKQMQEHDELIISRSGGPTSYTHAPKMLWWKNEQPETFEKIYKFVQPQTFVIMQMTGLSGDDAYYDYTTIHFNGFSDNLNKAWSEDTLSLFDMEKDKLPKIISPFEIVGEVIAEFAKTCGLKPKTPVCAGLGDTAASTFGSGILTPGSILDCAGTASVMACNVDKFTPDIKHKTLTFMRSPIDGNWAPLSYIIGGGLCLRWFRDNFTGKPTATYDELSAEAMKLPPGSEGILFVPHFAGRNLPQNPDVRGSFVGLDWKHTRGHCYRGVMEGIAYEYKYYFDVIRDLNPLAAFDMIYALGGGAKSSLFNQIKADVLGIPVQTFEVEETALIGSAVVAGVASGVLENCTAPLEKIMKLGEVYSPNMDAHVAYGEYAKQYLNVIDSLQGVYKSKIYAE